jgi:tetratricopeptide (TPR) repeat protein
MGNLETTLGNLTEAMKYLEKAQLIAARSTSRSVLAKIYLGIARVYYLQNQFDAARRWLVQAEMVVVRHFGADRGLMAQ